MCQVVVVQRSEDDAVHPQRLRGNDVVAHHVHVIFVVREAVSVWTDHHMQRDGELIPAARDQAKRRRRAAISRTAQFHPAGTELLCRACCLHRIAARFHQW
jgi:hypothetical protein